MSLKQNVGTIDRIVRIALAVIVLALYLTNIISGTVALILGILALVFLATGFIAFCPLYLPFKFTTRK